MFTFQNIKPTAYTHASQLIRATIEGIKDAADMIVAGEKAKREAERKKEQARLEKQRKEQAAREAQREAEEKAGSSRSTKEGRAGRERGERGRHRHA